jgi:hypothetical protein
VTDDDLTHRITITLHGLYPHGKEHEHASVTMAGDGSLDHFVDAFRAALVAAGVSASTAALLDMGPSR